jgi:NIMA (never in mitosis gene a)-related kinase
MERYELGRKLGQGAMGSVHLARRKSDGELLALKTVAVSSSHDRELAANEISILRSLQHTNIVSFYDSFVHQDEIVLVMQYCAGGDLADLIAQKRSSGDRIPDAHVRSMLCQLASALAHVHANRVVHRDIKSSNVFLMMSPDAPPGVGRSGLDADGPGVLLGDFGVAKTLESTKAMACTQCGTPYYLPPEVCNGASYNTRADMWSLGALPPTGS